MDVSGRLCQVWKALLRKDKHEIQRYVGDPYPEIKEVAENAADEASGQLPVYQEGALISSEREP